MTINRKIFIVAFFSSQMKLKILIPLIASFSLACAIPQKKPNLEELAAIHEKFRDVSLENKDISFYEELINKEPNNWKAHLELAECYFKKGADKYYEKGKTMNDSLENAEMHYKKSIEIRPSQGAYFHLGELYDIIGKDNEAIEINKNVAKIWQNDPVALWHLAQNYERAKQYNQAIKIWQKIIKLDPAKAAPYYAVRGDYSREEDIISAYEQISDNYYYMGEYNKALKYGNKVIKMLPNSSRGYINRAEVLKKIGQYEKAIEDYKKALQINPSLKEDLEKEINKLKKN